MYMSECMFIFLDFNQTLILSFFLFGGGIVGWLPLENIFTPRESLIKKIHSRKVTFKCHFLPQLRNLHSSTRVTLCHAWPRLFKVLLKPIYEMLHFLTCIQANSYTWFPWQLCNCRKQCLSQVSFPASIQQEKFLVLITLKEDLWSFDS